jgi:hypothetical protein
MPTAVLVLGYDVGRNTLEGKANYSGRRDCIVQVVQTDLVGFDPAHDSNASWTEVRSLCTLPPMSTLTGRDSDSAAPCHPDEPDNGISWGKT